MAKQTTYKQLTSAPGAGTKIAKRMVKKASSSGVTRGGTSGAVSGGLGYARTQTNRATGQTTTSRGKTTPVTKDEYNGTGRMSKKMKRTNTQR